MDLNKAIQFAQLVNAAYAVSPQDLTNAVGKDISVSYGGITFTHKVVTSIYACDLATDLNPNRGTDRVSIGLVLQSDGGDVTIAIRGTEGAREWIHDAEFLETKCPFLVGAGCTEDGFTAMYMSLAVTVDIGAPRLANVLAGLPFPKPVSSVTICGHSLGGALVTLLALDVAANTIFKNPTVYTYASPRTGNHLFVSTYDQVVPNTFRIANRVDLVPKLPPPPFYEHVLGLFELNPVKFEIPPKILIKFDVACEHVLNSYIYLLSEVAGAEMIPLDAACAA